MKVYFSLALILAMVSVKGWAKTPLQDHMLWVTQGMANLYMYQLTEGNKKYFKAFEQYQLKASNALEKVSNKKNQLPNLETYSTNWQILNQKLMSYGDKAGAGAEMAMLAGVVRREYREYLTNLYINIFNQETLTLNEAEDRVIRVQLLIAMLTTRVLDVVSDIYGPTGLTEHDNLFNPSLAQKKVTESIRGLMLKSKAGKQGKAFKKLQSKFNFLKSSLVDYQLQTPYFLIFENSKSINKLLNNHDMSQIAKQ